MYIESVPNRNSPPCILLRESYRKGKKVRKRTLVNLTHWPTEVVQGLGALLKGAHVVEPHQAQPLQEGFEIVRSLPHGHVAAVLGTLRQLGVDKFITLRRCRRRDLVVAMIVARVIDPQSKLATARGLSPETASTSLAEMLGLDDVDENDLYAAMDWLLGRQERIEAKLARRHLQDGTLVLYDVTSAYLEGLTDGHKGKLEIVLGLLCDVEGRPIAVEVFEGNVAGPSTLAKQIEKIRRRFGLERVVMVGDRGMLTEARIREELSPVEGLDWITALRAPAIRKLVNAGDLSPSLFDRRDLGEITSPEYPGERLIVCRNPLLAAQRREKHQALLAATEKKLKQIVAAVKRPRRPLRGADEIGIRVGKVVNRFKVGKHFRITIREKSFRYERDEEKIAREAALDGIYVVRTNVPGEVLDAEATACAYKGLSHAERAFRSLKTIDLKIRPIHHRLANRVRAHVFLCTLAYYVEWHMRQALAPILFDDDDKAAGEALRDSVVAAAQRSPRAQRKAATKRTDQDEPVHSFQTLLSDLGTICKNRIRVNVAGAGTFDKFTCPTPSQERALDLLGIQL